MTALPSTLRLASRRGDPSAVVRQFLRIADSCKRVCITLNTSNANPRRQAGPHSAKLATPHGSKRLEGTDFAWPRPTRALGVAKVSGECRRDGEAWELERHGQAARA